MYVQKKRGKKERDNISFYLQLAPEEQRGPRHTGNLKCSLSWLNPGLCTSKCHRCALYTQQHETCDKRTPKLRGISVLMNMKMVHNMKTVISAVTFSSDTKVLSVDLMNTLILYFLPVNAMLKENVLI